MWWLLLDQLSRVHPERLGEFSDGASLCLGLVRLEVEHCGGAHAGIFGQLPVREEMSLPELSQLLPVYVRHNCTNSSQFRSFLL